MGADISARGAGFQCESFENSDPRGGPFLIAERHERNGLPTVLSYGHGDVVHGQVDHWREGLQPFELVDEDARCYGRGTADNKGQHLINIAAVEAILATRGALGFDLKFVFEMPEEVGSTRLAADVLIASDGPRLQSDTATRFMGTRGAVNSDLVVDLRNGAHHSGNLTGSLPNE